MHIKCSIPDTDNILVGYWLKFVDINCLIIQLTIRQLLQLIQAYIEAHKSRGHDIWPPPPPPAPPNLNEIQQNTK